MSCFSFSSVLSAIVCIAGASIVAFGVYASSPADRMAGLSTKWEWHYVSILLVSFGCLQTVTAAFSPCLAALRNLFGMFVITLFLLAPLGIELAIAISMLNKTAANQFVDGAPTDSQKTYLTSFYARYGTTLKSDGDSDAAIAILACSVGPMFLLIPCLWIQRACTKILPPPSKDGAYFMTPPLLRTPGNVSLPPVPFTMNNGSSPSHSPYRQGGIGVHFKTNGEGAQTVNRLVSGGAAELSGEIESGDVIVAVDGQNVEFLPHAELAPYLIGPIGSAVEVTFRRPSNRNRVFSISLIRGGASAHSQPPTLVLPSSLPGFYLENSGVNDKVGVGIVLQPDVRGDLRVSGLVPGGAAEKSGQIQDGDRVIEVGGMPVSGTTVQSIQELILGPPGTTVRVFLVRDPNPQPFPVDLVRTNPLGVGGGGGGGVGLLKPQQLFPANGNNSNTTTVIQQPMGGIGVVLMPAFEGALHVTAVMAGGPASLAGVEVGDVLCTVDAQNISGMSLERVNAMIQGPLNSTVVLGFKKGANASDPNAVVNTVSCVRSLPELNASTTVVTTTVNNSGNETRSNTPPPQPMMATIPMNEANYYPPPPPPRQPSPPRVGKYSPRYHSPPRSRSSSPPTSSSSNNFGVGIFFQPDGDGGHVVNRLVPHGPAELTGRIYPGDTLLYVDGTSVAGLSNSQLAKHLLGRRGTSVRLGFKRKNSATGRIVDVYVERGASAEERGARKSSPYRGGGNVVVETPIFYQPPPPPMLYGGLSSTPPPVIYPQPRRRSPQPQQMMRNNNGQPRRVRRSAPPPGNGNNVQYTPPPATFAAPAMLDNNNNNNNYIYDNNNYDNNNNTVFDNNDNNNNNNIGFGFESTTPPVGIGLQLTPSADGSLVVSAVQPGGGAWRSEVIHVGDTVLSIDSTSIAGWSASQVASVLMGPSGSNVVLGVVKRTSGRYMDVTVERGWK